MKTRHTEFSIDDDSRDSIDVAAAIETRRFTRSRSQALTSSPRVILRQRRHQIDRYMSPRLVVTRSKRKKYSSYPDIEYAAAKRTKQNSNNSNQENHPNQEEVLAPLITQEIVRKPRRTLSPPGCSPRRTRRHPSRRHTTALTRLKRDLGEGYAEEAIRYTSDKPYSLRRERQIVMRYEAPDFREVHHRTSSEEEEEEEDDEEDEDEVDEEEEEEGEGEGGEAEDLDDSRRASNRNYSLRRKPPKVVRYEDNSFSEHKPRGMYHRSFSPERYHQRFPSRRGRPGRSRKDHTIRRTRHHSTTSESDSETEKDEVKFEKRKKKSMNQARARCLPMNLTIEDIQKGVYRERQKAGASMADIDPMSLDKSTDFTSVGGLDQHIHSLREMVVFPMLYPDVFEKFNIAPPRGVIFYGSPGTGKTLVARALANECGKDGQKISFFMRKGADCLSKWVGESERQLRLLFDQAYSMRPSIIFFDEIDGLAPVRSSRQEQIHSSIVSTLLALMDGLDSRGEVVVVGATNRLDAIDPALRRPGRFDREFHFPLPSASARAEILRIHTNKWSPLPHPDLLSVLADRTAGFCGADLKSLVTESALGALRRRYPQIYKTNKRLLLDTASIKVRAQDFYQALLKIQPAQARSSENTHLPLPQHIRPLLSDTVMDLVRFITRVMPSAKANCSSLGHAYISPSGSDKKKEAVELVGGEPEIYKGASARNTSYQDIDQFFSTLESYYSKVPSHRPRLLITSHNTLVMSSLLHVFEEVSLHEVSLTSLNDPNYRSLEEAAARIVTGARKRAPSILYIPFMDVLESSCNISVCNVLHTLLSDTLPGCNMVLIATLSTCDTLQEGSLFSDLFSESERVDLRPPTTANITNFFTPLLTSEIARSFSVTSQHDETIEELEEAPPVKPKPLSEEEIAAIEKREAATLRELRLFLRDMVYKLMKERKFYCFCKPVNLEEVSDYLEVVKKPMDLEKIREKIDCMEYDAVKEFICDVELIAENAIEYNPADDHTGRQIRHRAAELKDFLHSLLDTELDEDFATLCEEIKTARAARAEQKETESQHGRSRTESARNSGQYRGRHSVSAEEDSDQINGTTSHPQDSHNADLIIQRIVELLKTADMDHIIRLYTLISQIVIKNRSNKSMTRETLIAEHIEPVLHSFSQTISSTELIYQGPG